MPISREVNKDFFKKWSRSMAYIVGFFAADGYITINTRRAYSWNIQIKDLSLLKEIRKTVGSNHKIGIRVHKKYKTTFYRLQIGSKEMCEDLARLGFSTTKTKILIVPTIPPRFLGDFVRGYFDGDGNVWRGVINNSRITPTSIIQVSFTSCSEIFLKGFLYYLRKLGIRGGSLFLVGNEKYSRLNLSVNDTLKLYNIMYNKPHALFLKRKKGVFEKFIKMRL